jgi:uncharacterized repeat protein (TIGR04076 family)
MEKMVRVRVAAIDGHCDVHNVGDQFQIEGAGLVSNGPVCVHALPTLLQYAMMLREGGDPVRLGLAKEGRIARVACPDPGPPLTNGGVAIFEMELVEQRPAGVPKHRYVD